MTNREKRDFFLVMVLGTLSAFTELLGLASIVPLIALVSGSGEYYLLKLVKPAIDIIPNLSETTVLAMFSIIVLLLSIIITTMYSFSRNRYTKRVGARISAKILSNYLADEPHAFWTRSEAELSRNVGHIGTQISSGVIENLLFIQSRMSLLVFVFAWLIFINVSLTLLLVASFSIIYLAIHQLSRNYISNSSRVNFEQGKFLQEIKLHSYRSYRLIKLSNLSHKIIAIFSQVRRECARRDANIAVAVETPKRILESSGLILLVVSALVMSNESSSRILVPNMAVFTLCAYRVLPALQAIYSGFMRLTAAHAIHTDIVSSLTVRPIKTKQHSAPITANTIKLDSIDYRHPFASFNIFKNFSMLIEIDRAILFLGSSGIGKSTLFDLISGLISPDKGSIRINNRNLSTVKEAWWNSITLLSQDSSLFGDTLEKAITCLSEHADKKLLEKALSVSGAIKVIDSNGLDLQAKLNTSMLSSGEKNRLILARALYTDKNVLLLDEPFANLDLISARETMDNIYKSYPEKCFLIITHRKQEIMIPHKEIDLDKLLQSS